ncbi:hypothetical protein PWEIH_15688 [Listeria weihenstephanensis FSL R9-0317]|uniref:Uncharacterized protein n=1 Tax=Listeria weihenstephanensis TaxID=1006155 RepID=A0A1S7FXV5_9LIST|nr:hypothetical protein [Listeria weihenstephanensis]AQY52261.1 hypothetical protein UE46_15365 [Listeria weihenstephanensis]EUJ35376.1 hypothetical protein PWEIH_15688 [Listeria weihenstephanensis FSL R9-0317]
MAQQKLYLKKFYKNKGNLIPIVIFVAAILFVIVMNTRVGAESNFLAMAQDEIKTNKAMRDLNEQTMKELAETEEEKADFKANQDASNIRIQEQERMVSLYKNEDWSEAYKWKIRFLKEAYGTNASEAQFSTELKEAILRQIVVYEKLEKLDIKADQEDLEVQGVTFLYRMLANFFPVLFVIILCFTLNTVFTNRFRNNLDRSLLFPQKYVRGTSERLLFALSIAIFSYVLSGVTAYLSASLLSGAGSLKYPMALNTGSEIVTKPVGELLWQTVCLQILAIVVVILTIDFISKICRRAMPTLFISLLVLATPVLAVGKIEPLNRWAHLLPGSYFNATSICDNTLALLCDNGNITFINGIFVLVATIVVLLVLIYGIDIRRRSMITLGSSIKNSELLNNI